MMTDDKIKAIREALEKATPGPWEVGLHGDRVDGPDGFFVAETILDENAHLIAFARNELPGLLDELESLRAEIKAVQRRMHDAGHKSAAAMLNGVVRGEKSTG